MREEGGGRSLSSERAESFVVMPRTRSITAGAIQRARDRLQTNRINFRKDYIRSSRKRRYPFPAAVTFNPMAPGEI